MDSIKSIKFQHQLIDNLHIVNNVLSGTIVFWNKYQIFFFDELKYENLANICQWTYVSEFKITQVILSANYLICLDDSGYVYTSPLKFKQSAQKRIKSSLQQREKGLLCIHDNEDVTFSIQKVVNKLHFCVHKINSDFQLLNKIEISHGTIQIPTKINCGKLVFCSHKLNETQFFDIREIFQLKVQWINQFVVVLSFDNLTLYALLINLDPPQHESTLVKLLTCPSQIKNVSFVNDNNLCIYVSLASGTLIKLRLNSEYKTPIIIHLNKAIDKLLVFNNMMIYTDGVTMWKLENAFNVIPSFREFKVRFVKDFIRVADQIVCITYSNLIYLIPFENETCYFELPTTDEYSSSEHLLNNTDCLYKILDEIEKNNQIVKEIQKEENYITTLALSNRKDIMDDVVQYHVILHENYEDVLKENVPLTITNNIEEYFELDSYYFLIKITTNSRLQQKYSDILSNLFGNLKIHVTLLTEQKVLKTTSIKVQEQLKNINIVIPLNTQMLHVTNITVNINLVTYVPGVLNEKDTLWSNLHSKTIVFNPEHFIKYEYSKSNLQFLKEPKKSLKELIYEMANNHHGQLFKINKITKKESVIWPFYVKLPSNYQLSLINRANYFENLNPNKANYLLSEISSTEFLTSRSYICFNIANTKVEIELINDGFTEPFLRVTSPNPQVSLGVRNFLSNLTYNMFKSNEKRFVSYALYDSIEELEKSIKICTIPPGVSNDEFVHIFDQFQRCIIGAIEI